MRCRPHVLVCLPQIAARSRQRGYGVPLRLHCCNMELLSVVTCCVPWGRSPTRLLIRPMGPSSPRTVVLPRRRFPLRYRVSRADAGSGLFLATLRGWFPLGFAARTLAHTQARAGGVNTRRDRSHVHTGAVPPAHPPVTAGTAEIWACLGRLSKARIRLSLCSKIRGNSLVLFNTFFTFPFWFILIRLYDFMFLI